MQIKVEKEEASHIEGSDNVPLQSMFRHAYKVVLFVSCSILVSVASPDVCVLWNHLCPTSKSRAQLGVPGGLQPMISFFKVMNTFFMFIFLLISCSFQNIFNHLFLYFQDTAQPLLALQMQQLQWSVVSVRLEIHKDVISYQMDGALHGQGTRSAKSGDFKRNRSGSGKERKKCF